MNLQGTMGVTTPYKFLRFGAMEVTKPYTFIGFGAMDVTKPYKFIGFVPSELRLGEVQLSKTLVEALQSTVP